MSVNEMVNDGVSAKPNGSAQAVCYLTHSGLSRPVYLVRSFKARMWCTSIWSDQVAGDETCSDVLSSHDHRQICWSRGNFREDRRVYDSQVFHSAHRTDLYPKIGHEPTSSHVDTYQIVSFLVLPCILPERSALLTSCLSAARTQSVGKMAFKKDAVRWQDGFQGTCFGNSATASMYVLSLV